MQTEIWLTAAEAAKLCGLNKSSVCRKIHTFKTKIIDANGGRQYRILLASLPAEAQVKYFDSGSHSLQAVEDSAPLDLSTVPAYNRKVYFKRALILQESEGLTGNELKLWVAKWNAENKQYKTSFQQIYSWRKMVKQEGEIALIGKLGNRNSDFKTPDDLQEEYNNLYLNENRRTHAACYAIIQGLAAQRGVVIPGVAAFKNRLEREIPESVRDLKRYGESYWNKRWNNYIDRDYSNVKAGECWVSDHRQLDMAVRVGKKAVFPWLTVWRDFKSGMWLGWSLHAEDPNTDHILAAFFHAAKTYGIPRMVMIDNGKDYRSRDFAGGRRMIKADIETDNVRSVCALLSIRPIFVQPYNGQSKPVERDFKMLKEWFDRQFEAYRGGSIAERPENVMDMLHSNRVPTIEECKSMLNQFIADILHKTPSYGKALQGRSRKEAWAEELSEHNPLRKVSADDLKLFAMRVSGDLTIRRNGVTLSQKDNIYYYAPWMEGMKGTKVYLRRDPANWHTAWVFKSEAPNKDEYLGKGYLRFWQAEALAGEGLERKKLAELIAAKRAFEKVSKAMGDTFSPSNMGAQDMIDLHAAALAEKTRGKKLPTPKESKSYVISQITRATRKEQLRTGTDDLDLKPLNIRNNGDELAGWEE